MHHITEIEPIPYADDRNRNLNREIEDALYPLSWWKLVWRWFTELWR